MSDLISREGLINKAEYEAEAMPEPFKSQLPVLVAWLAEKIPSEEPAPQWIPCSVKKHPDKSMYCHVTVIDDGDYIVSNDDWDADSESWDEYSDDEIIAWMPEITPYQEGETK